jgi:hypothetical protein
MLDQLVLGLHLISYHSRDEIAVEREKCFVSPARRLCRQEVETVRPNNTNPGLYVRDEATGFGGGFYKNSEYKLSAHVDWTASPVKYIGLTFGVVSGYQRASLIPVVVPSVAIPLGEQAAARLSFLSGVKSGSTSSVHLSFEWRFK